MPDARMLRPPFGKDCFHGARGVTKRHRTHHIHVPLFSSQPLDDHRDATGDVVGLVLRL